MCKNNSDEWVEYTPVEGDIVRFAMKRPNMLPDGSDYEDTVPIVYKEIPIDTMILELEPGDTKTLSCGKYVYDIEITLADGFVDTFIAKASLKLTPEVV